MTVTDENFRPQATDAIDAALQTLEANKHVWARTPVAARIAMLQSMKDGLMATAAKWAVTAAQKKGIPGGSALFGEEWLGGPYACMLALNLYSEALGALPLKAHLEPLSQRTLPGGQLAVKVFPRTLLEKVLSGGVSAEVWMEPGVSADNLASNTAQAYNTPEANREGKIALVLGAGNVSSIAPLDVLHKLLAEHQVCILKLNPVNEYMLPYFSAMLQPAIDLGLVRIVKGGAELGAYLSTHPLVQAIHITGSEAVHDAIVWGVGDDARDRKRAGTPKNPRPVHSELGAVTPTIIVPGPWNEADLQHQAQAVASQKLQNCGFNCASSQLMLLSAGWEFGAGFEQLVKQALTQAPQRVAYYPGARQRLQDIRKRYPMAELLSGPNALCERVYIPFDTAPQDRYFLDNEVFCPVLGRMLLPQSDPEPFLQAAIDFSNRELRGTLSANIIIHPATLSQLGGRFDELLQALRYGCIGVNVWAAFGFATPATPWGAFPGHPLDDVQSGRGSVHNAFMFDRAQRTVLRGPFRAMVKPPWWVTHASADKLGPKLTAMEYRPSLLKLPSILYTALQA